jgi:hypothetical protein
LRKRFSSTSSELFWTRQGTSRILVMLLVADQLLAILLTDTAEKPRF